MMPALVMLGGIAFVAWLIEQLAKGGGRTSTVPPQVPPPPPPRVRVPAIAAEEKMKESMARASATLLPQDFAIAAAWARRAGKPQTAAALDERGQQIENLRMKARARDEALSIARHRATPPLGPFQRP